MHVDPPALVRSLAIAHYSNGTALVRDTTYDAETGKRVTDATYSTSTSDAARFQQATGSRLAADVPALLAVNPSTRCALLLTVDTAGTLDAYLFQSLPSTTLADLIYRRTFRDAEDARELVNLFLGDAQATDRPA